MRTLTAGKAVVSLGVLLTALIAITYSFSLDNGFIYDDVPLITERPPEESFVSAFDVFTQQHWHNLPYYRPVAGLTMVLQKTWHGNTPLMFHVLNIGLMVAASLLVFALLRLPIFAVGTLPAFLAAALFAVHPVGSSCVYPICSGRETLLPGVFILLAVYGWIRGGRRGYGIALLGMTLGLLSKEQAVIVPALFVSADLLKLTRPRATVWRRYLPVGVLFAGYFLVRHWIFRGASFGSPELALLDSPFEPLLTLCYMLQTWFAPFLELRYEPRFLVWRSWPHALAAVVLIAATVKVFYKSRDRSRQMLFFVVFAVAAVAPTANILVQEAHFAERYIWLAWLVVPACACLALREPGRPALIFSVVALLLLAGISVHRDRYFQSNQAFLGQWIKTDPDRAQPLASMGDILRKREDLEAAEPYYLQALERSPDNVAVLNNLGTLYQTRGMYDQALPHLRRAVELDPHNIQAWHNLAIAYASLNQTDEEMNTYLRAIEAGSRHAPSLYNLGLILASRNRVPEAVGYFERAIESDPAYEAAYFTLGHLYARENDLPRAQDLFRDLLRMNPAHAETHYALAVTYALQNELDLAIQHCREAVRLRPDFYEAQRTLELMLERQAQ